MTGMQEPPTTKYSPAFERCWKAHKVGVKKAAWKAGQKEGWLDENWDWLANYLEIRHKEDVKWLEGTYIPHLSSIINGERWQDQYKRKSNTVKGAAQTVQESHEEAMRKIQAEQARRVH